MIKIKINQGLNLLDKDKLCVKKLNYLGLHHLEGVFDHKHNWPLYIIVQADLSKTILQPIQPEVIIVHSLSPVT